MPALVRSWWSYERPPEYDAVGTAVEVEVRDGITIACEGVGGSGGHWDHGSFRQAGLDAHDLIAWLAAQPWSDGRVGMFGESYGGQTTYGAATDSGTSAVLRVPGFSAQ